jgi:hypothetical protein
MSPSRKGKALEGTDAVKRKGFIRLPNQVELVIGAVVGTKNEPCPVEGCPIRGANMGTRPETKDRGWEAITSAAAATGLQRTYFPMTGSRSSVLNEDACTG